MSGDGLEKTSAIEFDGEELKTIVQTFVQETTLIGAPADGTLEEEGRVVPGKRGQRYTVGNILGVGGMGVVLQAHDKNLDRSVAMKILQKARVKDSGHALRFIREAEITGALEHPNVIPLHELGLDADNNAYYTMKQVKGETLKAILKKLNAGDPAYVSNYPFRRLLEIFLKVCDAISLAHSKGIIHRDLKPENVMVGDFGEVLVIDWGLAKRLDDEADGSGTSQGAAESDNPMAFVTQVGAIMGTPGYMSPEQALGRHVGTRSDVYSLGAILYSILTFKPPVSGTEIREILLNVLQGNLQPPEDLWNSRKDGRKPPHLPGGVVASGISAVTMRALATHRDHRYASVEDLKRDIESFQAGYATDAERASLARQLGLLVKRHRKVGAAILVAGFCLALYGALFAGRLEREAAVAHDRQTAAKEALALSEQRKRAARAVLARLKTKSPTLFLQARYELDNNNIAKALQLIEHAITLCPENGDYHQLKGDVLQNQLEFKKSADAYDQALRLKGPEPGLVERKETSRSLAVAPRKPSSELLKALNQHMASLGRHRESLNVLSRMEYNPDDYFVTGEVYAKSKGWDVRGNVQQFDESWDIRFHKAGKGIYMNVKRCGAFFDLREIANAGVTNLSINRPQFLTGWEALVSENRLESLAIRHAKQFDLADVRGLNLKALEIHSDEVTNLQLVNDMGLQSLTLIGKGITDDAVAGLKGRTITRLAIQNVAVTNLDFLANLPSLTSLQVSDRDLDCLPPSELALSFLSLEGVRIHSLEGLNPSALRCLRISWTPLNNLEYFRKRECPNLTELYIAWCPLSDLSPLQNQTQLKKLVLYDTRISDLGPLAGHQLTELNIQSTAVTDLSPLKGSAPRRLMLYTRGLSDAEMEVLRSLKVGTINNQNAKKFWRTYDEDKRKRTR